MTAVLVLHFTLYLQRMGVALWPHILMFTRKALWCLTVVLSSIPAGCLQGLLILYPFLWWPLYSMLISQRRKKLKTA